MYHHKGDPIAPTQDTLSIQEAIELNMEAVKSLQQGKFLLHAKAVQLGIEALKHFKYHRDLNIISFVKQLPGETKE